MKDVLKIAFDADGPIFDQEQFQLAKKFVVFCKKKYGLNVINENGCNLQEIYGCNSEKEILIWSHFIVEYSLFFPPKTWIVEIISRLREQGHHISILTAKPHVAENDFIGKIVKMLFEIGLSKNKIYVDNIKYCSLKNSAESKKQALEEEKYDIVIEDNYYNAAALSEIKSSEILLMHTKNNQNILSENQELLSQENVSLVYDSNDIYIEIQKIINNIEGQKTVASSFIELSNNQKKSLTSEQKELYYNEYNKWLLNLPFNDNLLRKKEENFENINFFVEQFFKKKYKPQIIGEENIPVNSNGLIIVTNHRCGKDFFLIASALNIVWHPLIKSEINDEIYKYFFRLIYSVYVDRKNSTNRHLATRELAKLLAHNFNILICPEGSYTREDYPLKNFTGKSAVYLSQALQRPILPLAITDNYHKNSPEIVRIAPSRIVSYEENMDEANNKLWNCIAKMVVENDGELDKTNEKKYTYK